MAALKVFLTRPVERNGSVPQRLRALGIEVFELPALTLRPLPRTAVPNPSLYDVVVFVSRYAAQRYLQLWAQESGDDATWPLNTVAATVGASSANTLVKAGLPAHCIIHPPADDPAQDSETLLKILDSRGVALQRVLIVRGTQGRDWLGTTLADRGVQVEFLPVYERVPAAWSSETTAQLRSALHHSAECCLFLLTSSEGVQAIANKIGELGLVESWSRSAFLVIHERIAATLQSVLASQPVSHNLNLALCPPDDDAIVAAIHAVAGPTAEP